MSKLLDAIVVVLCGVIIILLLNVLTDKKACASTHDKLYDTTHLSAKDFYANVFDKETYIPKDVITKFIRYEERAIRALANRDVLCLPNYEGLLFTIYLYQLGAGYISAKTNTVFMLTEQFDRFPAHRIIKVGAYLHHAINC